VFQLRRQGLTEARDRHRAELNYDLESDLSPKSGTREFQEIRRPAERIGIAVGGLCSFLYWPYGYEVTSVDVRAAYSHTLKAAANAGVRAAVQTRIGALSKIRPLAADS
jgi:hypothetical protein